MKLLNIKQPSAANQASAAAPIIAPLPKQVVFPLVSPWGEASVLVRQGEQVDAGQCIAKGDEVLVPPVYASVSGTVKEIKTWPGQLGKDVLSIIIETSEQQSPPGTNAINLEDPHEVFRQVLAAGIREVDPRPWPLALRISSPDLIAGVLPSPAGPLTQPIETLIINGMDRQPGVYIRSATLVQQENDLLESIPLLQKLSSATRSVLAVTDVQSLSGDFQQKLSALGVELVRCPNRYPLALEPLITQFVTKKEVPQPANDTRMVGAAVLDVSAALNILALVRTGKPPTESIVQVDAPSAGVRQLVRVPIGMLLEDLVGNLSGLPAKPAKVIIGGLFLGHAQFSSAIPISQEIDAVTFQTADELHRSADEPCFNCGYCVRHCPMQLLPNELGKYCEYGKFDDAERNFLFHCIECGICAYVCPAKRPMVQLLRFGKKELLAMREAS